MPGGLFQEMYAYDISSSAIEQARERSIRLGYNERVHYYCEDFGAARFDPETFDFVVINMALHHVLDLEAVIANVRAWKKPEAPFVVHEFVGPSRFQWTDEAVAHGTRLLQGIPPRLRIHGTLGVVVERFERPSLRGMIEADPSEAIRSADIMPLLRAYFEVVDERPYGGTLMQPLMADIIHNFRPEQIPEDREVLETLFAEERALIKSHAIDSNYTLLVLK